MIISYQMLSSICSKFKTISPDDFIKALDNVGIEVESITRHPITHGLEIVKIIDFQKHPNADNLNIVSIKWNDELISLVCGAKNLVKNKYAIYAPVGTQLYNGLTIEPRTIRGVISHGMLCAYSELTNVNLSFLYDDDKNGIILLDEADISTPDVMKLLNLNDIIFDLSIPSNRNDLNSYLGIVQEVSSQLNLGFSLPFELDQEYNLNANINIDYDDDFCNGFGLVCVKNIMPFKPSWKQKSVLLAHCQKIHNNWLDFFNLISLIYNNPVHVYDLDKIPSFKNIQIKPINHLQQALCLDNNSYNVDNDILGVYSDGELINLAGVLGLDKNKFDDNTKNILIEIANFNHLSIRKSAEKLKLNTTSSMLFAKPISIWNTLNTFNHVYNFFASSNCNVSATSKFKPIDFYAIEIDFDNFNKFIGVNYSKEQIVEIFKKMNFIVEDNLVIFHPSRLDLQNQYDLYEELLKVIGINHLPITPILSDVKNQSKYSPYDDELRLRNFLVDNGLYEVKTYNLVSHQKLNKFNFLNIKDDISIINPLSNARQYYRKSMVDDHLDVLRYNNDRKRELNSIFEIQQLYLNKEPFDYLSMTLVNESRINKLAKINISWNILTIKNFLSNISNLFNCNFAFKVNESSIGEVYDNGSFLILLNNETIGYIAKIKNSILHDEYDLNTEVFAVMLNLSALLKHKNHLQHFLPVSNLPVVYRDFNIAIKIEQQKNFKINELINLVKQLKLINDCQVIDYFENDQLVTYTLRVKIVSLNNTLTTDEINELMQLVNEIKQKYLLSIV